MLLISGVSSEQWILATKARPLDVTVHVWQSLKRPLLSLLQMGPQSLCHSALRPTTWRSFYKPAVSWELLAMFVASLKATHVSSNGFLWSEKLNTTGDWWRVAAHTILGVCWCLPVLVTPAEAVGCDRYASSQSDLTSLLWSVVIDR